MKVYRRALYSDKHYHYVKHNQKLKSVRTKCCAIIWNDQILFLSQNLWDSYCDKLDKRTLNVNNWKLLLAFYVTSLIQHLNSTSGQVLHPGSEMNTISVYSMSVFKNREHITSQIKLIVYLLLRTLIKMDKLHHPSRAWSGLSFALKAHGVIQTVMEWWNSALVDV